MIKRGKAVVSLLGSLVVMPPSPFVDDTVVFLLK